MFPLLVLEYVKSVHDVAFPKSNKIWSVIVVHVLWLWLLSVAAFLLDLKLDYELREKGWCKLMRSSANDWSRNVDTIINWSPYASETELLQQVFFCYFCNENLKVAFWLWSVFWLSYLLGSTPYRICPHN